MQLSEFDYELPSELIAQFPTEKRENSRLLVLDKKTCCIEHKHFFDITDYLGENDLLVLNDTKVIPARLLGHKVTGAFVEIFLLKNTHDKIWHVLLKPAKRLKMNDIVEISHELSVKILHKYEDGIADVELIYDGNIFDILNNVGKIPLPPYIERKLSEDEINKLDFERYQTVYAKNRGSVAAPTAGLHFTPEVLQKLENKGVEICYVTLNVGLGTFRPVKTDDILNHKMHSEDFEITDKTAEIIGNAQKNSKNIVAVGTTTTRVLETTFKKYGEIKAVKDASELFIYPGYKFNVINTLITNFHLPKSTLLMLVCALAGKKQILNAYKIAIAEKYRFYSYGDCMLIK